MKNKTDVIMIPAVIEMVILWMVLFVSFVIFLFMVIDYGSIMRVKGNVDLLAEYGARMLSLGKTPDEVASGLNNIKNVYFASIGDGDIICSSTATGNYQVIFTVTGLYTDTKILTQRDAIVSKRVVFNERSSDETNCVLTLTKQ
jgi:Flp pilus assembly protein TadG